MIFIQYNKINDNDLIREKLLFAMERFDVSLDTLSEIFEIDLNILSEYLNYRTDYTSIDINTFSSMSNLSIFLSTFRFISNDEDSVLKANIETLLHRYNFTIKNLSLYSGISESDILKFMNDSNSVSQNIKYRLSIIVMTMSNLFFNKLR